MKETRYVLDRLQHLFIKANYMAIGLMMGLMFVLVFFNVIGRYCFHFSLSAAEEISSFLMIWVTYIGAGLALRQGRHAAIDVFQGFLPEKARRITRAVLGVVILLFFAALAYYGTLLVIFGWSQETAATQISKGIPYLGIPIGAMVFGLHLVIMFREWMDKDWEKEPLEEVSLVNGG